MEAIAPMDMGTNDWISTLQTGDLLFFHGTRLTSVIIEMSSLSPWSHVGMVVRSPTSGHLCLWEATNHICDAAYISIVHPPAREDPDYDDWVATSTGQGPTWRRIPGPSPRGVRLVDLRDKLGSTEYPERHVGVMRSTPRTAGSTFERRVHTVVEELIGAPYERDAVALFNSWWDWCGLGQNVEDESSFFCSELMVTTLQRTGVMDRIHGPGDAACQPASEWTVEDMVQLGTLGAHPTHPSPMLALQYHPMRVYASEVAKWHRV